MSVKTTPPAIYVGPEPWPELIEVASEFGTIADNPVDGNVILWFGRDPQQIVGKWSDKLQWLQLPDAGIEKWLVPEIVEGNFSTTSASGAYGGQVAEHALSLILAGYHELVRASRALQWDPSSLKVSTLREAQVLIVGAGGIGTGLSELLEAFSCNTTFATKFPRQVGSGSISIGFADIKQELSRFDVVVLACPSTDETRWMVDSRFLQSMNSDSMLINVARGDLVVTRDLIHALETHQIRFAGLDVTSPEPLPADSKLFKLSNCLITPHVANPPEQKKQGFVHLARLNLENFTSGKPLRGTISTSRGY